MSRFSRLAGAGLAALALSPVPLKAQSLRAEFFGEPFGRITDLAAPDGDSGRLFSADKPGRIRILSVPGGQVLGTFLDISPLVRDVGEGGLLGLAFHPDYASNGKFYVSYTTGVDQGDSILSEFRVSATDPDVADPASESIVWGPLPQFSAGHKAGDIEFGPDGMLYLALGDGDPAGGDAAGNAQNLADPRGKILRFDVDAPFPHVPADNPYVGQPGALELIWASGLRNPWRISIDPLNGDLYIGDVGQSGTEEINFAPGGVGGLNFGWNCREGSACFGGCTDCANPAFTDPLHSYDNGNEGCAVMGGIIYRGSAIPSMVGHYVYADLCLNEIWTLREDSGSATDLVLQQNIEPTSGQWRTLAVWGRDGNGEMYAANHFGGEVFRIVDGCDGSVQSYCQAAPNASGSGARLTHTGSLSLGANDFALEVDAAGAGRSGLFYYGTEQVGVPFGDGFRCVGGATVRLAPSATTDGSGAAVRPVDFQHPRNAVIVPGTSWHFQFWYRDPGGPGGSGFNLSDALAVTFCP